MDQLRLDIKLPNSADETASMLRNVALTLYEECSKRKVPVILPFIGMVADEGPMKKVTEHLSKILDKSSEVDVAKIGIGTVSAFALALAEREVRPLLEMEDGSIDEEWLMENRFKASMHLVSEGMSKLACPCSACIGLWAVRIFSHSLIDNVDFSAEDHMRHAAIEVVKDAFALKGERDEEQCVLNWYQDILSETE